LKVFKSAVLRAGLPASTSSHDLRHHYASVLLNAGESTFTVADRIGDSPKMVFDTYGHPMPGTEEATRKAIEAAWSVTSVSQSKTSIC
jgi:site-specific recombinase XerD